MKNFRCLNLAIELYGDSKKVRLPMFMKDQLLRAMSSVALNLAEGNDRRTLKDKRRMFNIAYTSLQEVKCIARMENLSHLNNRLEELSKMLCSLIRNLTEAVTGTETETAKKIYLF